MGLLNPAASALRLPRRTLRAQLALLYTAVLSPQPQPWPR